MKLLLETMFAEARAQYWYRPGGGYDRRATVRGAIVESKSGREAVLAKVVVDCSGDGDAAARAGVLSARTRCSACQPMTLMFEIDGVGRGCSAPSISTTG